MLRHNIGGALAWNALTGMVYVPHTEDEYRRLVALLDDLIDEVGENETHPLASLMEIIGVSLSIMKMNMFLS